MSQPPIPTVLDQLLNKTVMVNGTATPQRGAVNFIASGASWADNPTNGPLGSTDITVPTGSVAPVYFSNLSTLVATGRQAQYIDAYSAGTVGRGGEGWFQWNPTSTATADGGTVVQVTGVATGRWVRQKASVLSVRWYGAAGDGVTDDTAAIQLALTAFATAYAAGTATALYFPAGTYLVSSMLTLTAATGARIYGDGKQQSILQGTAALCGQPALLRMAGDYLCHVEHLYFTGTASTTTITAAAAAGATSITVATASPGGIALVAGQLIGLGNVNGLGGTYPGRQYETAIIANTYTPGSTTVPLTVGLLYSYVANSVVVTSVGALVDLHEDPIGTGTNSHGNTFENLQFGAAYLSSAVTGVSFTCASGHDQNNEEHKFNDCQFVNLGECSTIYHSNSLDNRFASCDFGGVNAVGLPNGGSTVMSRCGSSVSGTLLRVGGTVFHAFACSNHTTEDSGRLLDIFGGTSTVSGQFHFSALDAIWTNQLHTSGTVTVTNNSTSVVGVGTFFTKEYAKTSLDPKGYASNITFPSAQNGTVYQISNITDDTHLTLSNVYTGTTTAGTGAEIALYPVVNCNATQTYISFDKSNICLSSDIMTVVLQGTDAGGTNISKLSLSQCNTGLAGYSLSSCNIVYEDSTWGNLRSAPLYTSTTGTCTATFLSPGSNGITTGFGWAIGANNGARWAQISDVPGSSGGQSGLFLGNIAAPSSSNAKIFADDTTLTVNPSSVLSLNIGGASAISIGSQIAFGKHILGNSGLNGLPTRGTQIALTTGTVDTTSAGTGQSSYPVFVLTGTLTGNCTVKVVANTEGEWRIVNQLSLSGFSVTFTDGTNTTAVLNAANAKGVMSLVYGIVGFTGLAIG